MKLNRLISILLLLTTLIGCGADTDDEAEDLIAGVPLTPKMHLHQRDLPDDEWGPDALTDTDGIHIEWDANSDLDLAGYRVYRSLQADEGFKKIDDVSKDFTTYEDADVRLETKYCYRVTAVDQDENESTMSEPACYTLMRKSTLIEPSNRATLDALPTFRWIGVNEPGFHKLRVFVGTDEPQEPLREIWHYETIDFDQFEVIYNKDGTATENLAQGQEYRWRVDFELQPTVGSESNWRFFQMKP